MPPFPTRACQRLFDWHLFGCHLRGGGLNSGKMPLSLWPTPMLPPVKIHWTCSDKIPHLFVRQFFCHFQCGKIVTLGPVTQRRHRSSERLFAKRQALGYFLDGVWPCPQARLPPSLSVAQSVTAIPKIVGCRNEEKPGRGRSNCSCVPPLILGASGLPRFF